MAEKRYNQADVDTLIRKNMIDSQLQISNQKDRIFELEKQLMVKEQEIQDLKKREKLVSRALILADRRAKYIESTAKTRCAIEVDNLARFSEKWNSFFNSLESKYESTDKEKLVDFDNELKAMIKSLSEMKDMNSALTEPEMAYESERKRLSGVEKSVDDRFKKLCNEFDMKVGDNATRKPGRPKKNTGNKKVDDIIDELENGKIEHKPKIQKPLISSYVNKKITTVSNVPKTDDSIFDFDAALNPTEDLETILNDLLGDDI